MRGEGEEVGAVRVGGHGVADGGDEGPASGGIAEAVICDVGKESRVS